MSEHTGRGVRRRDLLRGVAAGVAFPGVAAGAARAATPGKVAPAAAVPDMMSDTWVGTDGLGRRLPTHDEVGGPRQDRYVGVFYFLWLGQHSTSGPHDISEILTANPAAMENRDDPAWGPMGHFHHWAEPYFGYYLSDDTWVIRKHATMLADAGVDTVIFDVTNGFTYAPVYHALLDTFAAVRAEGSATPQVAFLTPFGNPQQVVMDLYTDLYRPGTHSDLWFRWKDKPLILADPARIGGTLLTKDGSDPAQLAPGHTQGQTFRATEPIVAAGGRIPTWATTGSAMTLTLYAGGPGGSPLAQRRFEAVADNAQAILRLDQPAPAGTYYLEQSDPSGEIGWWTDPADVYGDGQAYTDGAPVTGDRALYVEYASSPAGEVLDFFTFRAPQPSYFTGPAASDQWGWLEVSPQHVFRDDRGAAEQMTAGVAQNAVDGRLGAMSEPHAQGRSYHDGRLPADHSRTAEGLNFQEQWDRVLAVDPEFVFVTGWNEWTAQRLDSFNGVDAPVVFVDEFDWEHSRDIEPLRGGSAGGFPGGSSYQDAYYYQLVANIRKYKGVRPLPRPSAPRTIRINGDFTEWGEVGPEFRDHAGDTAHRDHPGWGDAGRYVDTTGRNDVVLAKVARDAHHLFCYVRTRQPITPWTDRNWMMLFLDVTGDPGSGWEGFGFVVNRRVTSARRTRLEASRGGWSWEHVADIPYAVIGHEMELAIPRSLIGAGPEHPLRVDFKWIDNMQRDGDILDTLASGDAAPSGRFRYRYAEPVASFAHESGDSQKGKMT